MNKITEIIPDDMPEWANDAIDSGQFFRICLAKVEEAEKNNQWISVEDRLPIDNETVIVAGGIGYILDDVWYSATGEANGKIIQWIVEHWMELPRPPK